MRRCALCGQWFHNVPRHVVRVHALTSDRVDPFRATPTDGREADHAPGELAIQFDPFGGPMKSATQQWLSYTDGLLAKGDEASAEIALLMSVQRGPDYVRTAAREGALISPKSDDRQPVKSLTTAVLRALCFPQTAAALSKGSKLVQQLQKDFGVSASKAQAVADLLNGDAKAANTPNWQVADFAVKGNYAPFNTYSGDRRKVEQVMAQIGSASHFGIKVRKAAALFGYSI